MTETLGQWREFPLEDATWESTQTLKEQFLMLDLEYKVILKEERTDEDPSKAIHNANWQARWADARRASMGCMHGLDHYTWGAHGVEDLVKEN